LPEFFRQEIKVKTYTNDLFQKLNTGFFVCLLVIVAINRGGTVAGFALLIGIYGFWILVYGTIFNFRPSIIGAWITFACSLGAMFVNEFQYTMLLHAAGVLAGYIIPGHMALHEFKKVKPRIGIN
jgi:hypothetical protein